MRRLALVALLPVVAFLLAAQTYPPESPHGLLTVTSDDIAWPLLAPDGAVDAVSIGFADDDTMGMWRRTSGNDTLMLQSVGAAGLRKVQIDQPDLGGITIENDGGGDYNSYVLVDDTSVRMLSDNNTGLDDYMFMDFDGENVEWTMKAHNSGSVWFGIDLSLDGFKLDSLTQAKPTCDSTTRGRQWRVEGGAGVADTLEVCAKNTSNTYAWYATVTVP